LILITLLNQTALLADATYNGFNELNPLNKKPQLCVDTVDANVKWEKIKSNSNISNTTKEPKSVSSELKTGKYIVMENPKIFKKMTNENQKEAKAFQEISASNVSTGDIIDVTEIDYYRSSTKSKKIKLEPSSDKTFKWKSPWNIHILGKIGTNEWIQIEEYQQTGLQAAGYKANSFCKFIDPSSITEIESNYYRAPQVKNDKSQAILHKFEYDLHEKRYKATDVNSDFYQVEFVVSQFSENLKKEIDQNVIDTFESNKHKEETVLSKDSSGSLENIDDKDDNQNENKLLQKAIIAVVVVVIIVIIFYLYKKYVLDINNHDDDSEDSDDKDTNCLDNLFDEENPAPRQSDQRRKKRRKRSRKKKISDEESKDSEDAEKETSKNIDKKDSEEKNNSEDKEDTQNEESADEKGEDSKNEETKKSLEQDGGDSESENEDPSRDSNTHSEQASLEEKRIRRRKRSKTQRSRS
jgi:hypothetical protein